MNSTAGRIATLALSIAVASTPAVARSQDTPREQFARVTVVRHAIVYIQRLDGKRVDHADVGTPLFPGDEVSVAGPRALAEFRIGDRAALRTDGDAAFAVTQAPSEIRIVSGSVALSLVRGGTPPIAFATPALHASSSYAGDYRIAVEHQATTLTVRSGELHVEVAGHTYRVFAGKSLVARAGGHETVAFVAAPPADALDAFDRERDNALVIALQDDNGADVALSTAENQSNAGDNSLRWALPNTTNTTLFSYGASPYGESAYGQWSFAPQYGWYWVPPTAYGLAWFPQLDTYVPYGVGPGGYLNYAWPYGPPTRITPPPGSGGTGTLMPPPPPITRTPVVSAPVTHAPIVAPQPPVAHAPVVTPVFHVPPHVHIGRPPQP